MRLPNCAGRGFSLLELLLAMALFALLTALSVPRMQTHAQRALLLEAQSQLMGLAADVAVWHSLYGRQAEQIRGELPEAVYSERGEMLYRLSFEVENTDEDESSWSLLASPPADSALSGAGRLRISADGHCHFADAPDARSCQRPLPSGLRTGAVAPRAAGRN